MDDIPVKNIPVFTCYLRRGQDKGFGCSYSQHTELHQDYLIHIPGIWWMIYRIVWIVRHLIDTHRGMLWKEFWKYNPNTFASYIKIDLGSKKRLSGSMTSHWCLTVIYKLHNVTPCICFVCKQYKLIHMRAIGWTWLLLYTLPTLFRN